MIDITFPLVGFVTAAAITLFELITSKYPNTYMLLACFSWRLWVCSLIYGIIAFACLLGLETMIAAGTIKLEGTWAGNPWAQAFGIGVSVKALLHVRLCSVTVDSKSFPVGIESIVQIFEPWFLEGIDMDEWHAVRKFVKDRMDRKYKALPIVDIRKRIIENIPMKLRENGGFKLDLEKCESPLECLELYLRKCGTKIFDMTFPP